MRQIISLLAILFLAQNVTYSQSNSSAKPVKKVVTSKITKDPKTGKVVKTITTITTTDIVLVPGSQPNKAATVKPANTTQNTISKPITKKAAIKPKAVVAVKKPAAKVPAKTNVVVKKAPQKIETESGSIFTNTEDVSVKSEEKQVLIVEEKPEINKPFESIIKTTTTTTTKAAPPKVFKEKKYRKGTNYFGLRGGLNLATVENAKSLSPISSATINKKLGLNAGILLNFGLSKVFSIQPEINFSQQGYQMTNGFDTEKLNSNNLNIPILLKMALGAEKTKVFITAGPYYGLKIKTEKIQEINGIMITNLTDFTTEAGKEVQVNRNDYGVQTGVGIQFNLGGPLLEIEGRYNYGLADASIYTISKPSYIGQTGQTRLLTGTIGLLFPIGK